ncbi:hypothetical protein HYV70_01880 [Candidatus Uhrbacteria bacterium]|nr:hypothetical protein [Candidatus Uhrbacteria bacterium]
MKLFAIYARVVLDEDFRSNVFRQKDHDLYNSHITLVQSRFISEEDIPDLKRVVSSFFESVHIPNHRIDLIFNTLIPEQTSSEKYCLMIGAVENKTFMDLQKNLVSLLGDYTNYCNQETKAYEESFRPHITIEQDLNREAYTKALDERDNQYNGKGSISEIVLSIVNEDTVEESRTLENMTVFKL